MQDAKENVSHSPLSPASPLSVSPEGVARELAQLAAALETLAPPETKASEVSAFAAEDFLRAEEKRHRSADAAFNYLHLRRAALSVQDLQTFAELSHRYFAKVLLGRTLIQELRTHRPIPVQVVLIDNWLKQYQELGQNVHLCLPTAAWVDFCAHASDILAAKGYLQPERILPAVPETKTREAAPAPPLDLRQHTAWQEYYEELYSRLTNELLAARAILTDRLQEAATPADTVISTVTGAIPVVGQALGKIAGTASAVVKHRSAAEVAAWAKTLPEIDQLARWLARTFVDMRHEQLLTLTESDFSTLTQLQQKWKEVREKDSFSLARKLALQDLRLVLELLPQCARSNVLDAERRVAENVATVQQAFQQHVTQTAQPQPPTLPLLERVKRLPEQIGPLKKKAVLALTLSASTESPKDKKAEASSPTDEAEATLLCALCLTLPQTSDTANAWQFQQAGMLAATALKENATHRQIGGTSLTHLQTAGSLQQRTDYWAARCMIRLADLTANATPAWADVMALWHDVSAYLAIAGSDAQQSLWQRLNTVWSSQAAEDVSQRALQQQIASITTVAACQTLHAQVMDLVGGLSRWGQHTVAETLARQYTDRARQAFAQIQAKHLRLQTEAKQTKAQDQQRQARRDSWSQKLQSWQQQLAAIRGPAASGEPASPSVSPAEMTPAMQHFAQTLQEAWRQDKTLAVLEEQYAKQYALWQQHQRQGLPSAADTFQTLEVGLTQLQRLISIEQAQNTTTVQTQEELLATQQLCQVWETNSENAMAQYRALTSPSASSSQAFAQSSVITTPKPEQKNASTNLVQRLEAELGEPPCGFAMLTASIIVTADDKPRSHAAYTTAAEPHVALLMTDPRLQDHPYWRAYAQLWQWHRQCQDPLRAMATTVQVWVGTPGALPQHVLWATCEGHSQTDAPQATQLFADYQQQCRAHLQAASAEQVPFARSYGYHGLQALFSRPLPVLPTADQPLSISEVLLTPLQDLILQLGLYYGVSVATLTSCSAVLDALASQARFSPAFMVDLRAALSWAESQQAHATTPVAHRGSPLAPAQRRELQHHHQYTVQALWQRCHTTAEREPLWRLTGELPQQFDPLWEGFEATCTALRKGTIPLEGIDRALDFLAQVLVHRQQFAWAKHRQYLFDLPADQRLAYVEKLAQALPPAQHSLVTRLHHVPLPNGRRLTQEIEQRDWEKAVQQLWQPAEGAIAAESKSSNSSTPIQFVRARQVAGITGPQWQLQTHVLHPTIACQLFKPNGEWQDKDKQHGGNHRVYPIAAGGKVLFWVKVYPEQPASEFLVTELDRRLGIGGTPQMELVKFQHGGKTSAAVLTAAINGIDLQTVVDKTPDQLKRLSFAAFIRTLLRVLLTNPEDDKGDDYFFIPQADGSGALVRIDNERAFFQPSSERQKLLFKSEHLLVKSIVYCLEQMQWQWADDPAVAAVLEDFLHLQPVALVSDLLQTADQLHDGWNLLFSEGEVTAHFNCKDPWASLPVMCIPNGLARELITRLTVMHTALRLEHAQMTGLQLLKVTQPKLAQYYVASHSSLSSPTKTTLLTPFRAEQKGAAPFESKRRASASMITTRETADHSRVSARFERVAGHLYQKKNLKDAHNSQHSLMPSSVAMQSSLRLESPIDLATLQKIRSKQTCSAKQQLSEFDQWQKSQRLRLIGDLAAQKTTAVAEWQGLPLRQQYQVFTQLQAQQLSVEQQRFILQALAAVVSETAWPQLDFNGFEEVLTDTLLEPLLKAAGQQLLQLNVNGCSQLTDKSLKTLLAHNPHLRRLQAQRGAWTTVTLTALPHLEQLDLSGSAVQTLAGEAPRLRSLQLKDCSKLQSLGETGLLQNNPFAALPLTQVDLSGCSGLTYFCAPQAMLANRSFTQSLSACTGLTAIVLQTKTGWLRVPDFLIELIRSGTTRLGFPGDKRLTPTQWKQLANYLSHDRFFTTLNLENQLSEADVQALVKALKTNAALTTLNLSNNALLGDAGAQALAEALKTNTALTTLNLSNNPLGDIGVQALAEVLKTNTTITTLDLHENLLSETGRRALGVINIYLARNRLQKDPTLTHLNLSNTPLGDAGVQALAEVLKTNTTITTLDLHENLLSETGRRALGVINIYLARNRLQKDDPTLTALDFSYNPLGDIGVQALAEALKNNTTLTHLNLSNTPLGDAGVQALAEVLKTNTTLTVLDLHNNQLSGADTQVLAETLKTNASLTTLNLSENQLGDAGVQALAEVLKTNTTLTTLDLHKNLLSETGRRALGVINIYLARNRLQKGDPTLTALDFSYNPLGDIGVQALAEALKNNTTLTHLNLSNNPLGEAGVQTLAEVLKTNTTLTTLDLHNNQLSDAGAQILAETLKTNASLTTLNLSENQLGDAGAQVLAEALKTNASLTTLNLSFNQLGDAGAQALTDVLKTNVSLATLNLSFNPLGEAGAQVLAEALKINTALATLNLSTTRLGEAGAQALAEALKTNTTLTTLNLSFNPLGEAGAQALAGALKTNTTLTIFDLSYSLLSRSVKSEIEACLARNRALQKTANFVTQPKDSKSTLLSPSPQDKKETKGMSKLPATIGLPLGSLSTVEAIRSTSELSGVTAPPEIATKRPPPSPRGKAPISLGEYKAEAETVDRSPFSQPQSSLPAPHAQFFSSSAPRDEKSVTLLAEVQHALDQVYPERGDTRQAYLMQLAEFQSRPGILSKPERDALQGLLTTLREAAIQRMVPPSDPSVLD